MWPSPTLVLAVPDVMYRPKRELGFLSPVWHPSCIKLSSRGIWGSGTESPALMQVTKCMRENEIGKRGRFTHGNSSTNPPIEGWAASLASSCRKKTGSTRRATGGGSHHPRRSIKSFRRIESRSWRIRSSIKIDGSSLSVMAKLDCQPAFTADNACSQAEVARRPRQPPPRVARVLQESVLTSSNCTDHCDFFYY
jgi:hypothetical protein